MRSAPRSTGWNSSRSRLRELVARLLRAPRDWAVAVVALLRNDPRTTGTSRVCPAGPVLLWFLFLLVRLGFLFFTEHLGVIFIRVV